MKVFYSAQTDEDLETIDQFEIKIDAPIHTAHAESSADDLLAFLWAKETNNRLVFML